MFSPLAILACLAPQTPAKARLSTPERRDGRLRGLRRVFRPFTARFRGSPERPQRNPNPILPGGRDE